MLSFIYKVSHLHSKAFSFGLFQGVLAERSSCKTRHLCAGGMISVSRVCAWQGPPSTSAVPGRTYAAGPLCLAEGRQKLCGVSSARLQGFSPLRRVNCATRSVFVQKLPRPAAFRLPAFQVDVLCGSRGGEEHDNRARHFNILLLSLATAHTHLYWTEGSGR